MEIQLSSFSPAADSLLAIGVGLIVFTVVYLRFLGIVGKTRNQFLALQPDVRITRSATVYSNGEDILTIFLRNSGGSLAKDIRVTVHGGEGLDPLPIIPVMNSGDSEKEVWIKAKPGSPLLQEKRDHIRLMIHYRDQWGYSYVLSYPVVQHESTFGWVSLRLVDRGKPRVTRPSMPFWRMRAHLAGQSQIGCKGKITPEVSRGSIDVRADESLSPSLIRAYFCQVWRTQNTQGRMTNNIQYHPAASRLPSGNL